ncbi:MAG: hypothetical protein N3A38_01630 [Planctomycetota bacterium]|nr:hypothetical protein [Planctomycetota bacterium]
MPPSRISGRLPPNPTLSGKSSGVHAPPPDLAGIIGGKRPSESIEGLDSVGLEAGRTAARRSDRASRTPLNRNVALRVSPEAERIGRIVRIGFLSAGVSLVLLFAILVWIGSSKGYDDATAEALTKDRLQRYQALAVRLPPLGRNESLKAGKVADAFKALLKERLASVEKQAETARREQGTTGRALAEEIEKAEGDAQMRDFWGRGIKIEVDAGQDVVRFVSRGADGKEGTDDDLVACSRIGRMGEVGVATGEGDDSPPPAGAGSDGPPPPPDGERGKSDVGAPVQPAFSDEPPPAALERPPGGERQLPKGAPPPPPPKKKISPDDPGKDPPPPKPSTEVIY